MPTARLTTDDHRRDSAGLRYVYPVVSRRAGGVSVGINLNINNACNWQCIYCQVPDLTRGAPPPVDLDLLERELDGLIAELLHGNFMETRVAEGARRVADVALSGNGEPTSAPEFPRVIELVARVLARHQLGPRVPIRVITNGSLMGRDYVQAGLQCLASLRGEVWFKVDAGTRQRIRQINQVDLDPASVIRNLRTCADLCPTWVQTCMFKLDGQLPSEADLAAYLKVLEGAGTGRLRGVHLYGLARPSMQAQSGRLERLGQDELERVGEAMRKATGLTVTVSP